MYSVLWSPDAERELQAILSHAGDSASVTQAFLALNQLLRTDPDRIGESRPKGRRVTFLVPLGVRFEVRWREQTVLILRVWHYRPRGQRP